MPSAHRACAFSYLLLFLLGCPSQPPATSAAPLACGLVLLLPNAAPLQLCVLALFSCLPCLSHQTSCLYRASYYHISHPTVPQHTITTPPHGHCIYFLLPTYTPQNVPSCTTAFFYASYFACPPLLACTACHSACLPLLPLCLPFAPLSACFTNITVTSAVPLSSGRLVAVVALVPN